MIGVLLAACSSNPASDGEREYYRTRFCVSGSLPVEYNNRLYGAQPPILDGAALSREEVRKFADSIDAAIAHLLVEAFESAIDSVDLAVDEINARDFEMIESKFADYVLSYSSQNLNLDYCGDEDAVSLAVWVMTIDYFLRALPNPTPEWFVAGRGLYPVSVLMMAVANELSDGPIDVWMLLPKRAHSAAGVMSR